MVDSPPVKSRYFEGFFRGLKPDTRLTVSEWIDKKRIPPAKSWPMVHHQNVLPERDQKLGSSLSLCKFLLLITKTSIVVHNERPDPVFAIADRSLRLRVVDRDCQYSFSMRTEKRGALPSEFLLELWVVSAELTDRQCRFLRSLWCSA